MALEIESSEAERLAHELAAMTGESLTETVTVALRERLAKLRQRSASESLHADVAEIQAAIASLSEFDPRSEDEILGYDEFGLPQ